MRVGFLGFGEAGYVISQALLANGLPGAVAYDCNHRHPLLGETIRHRAQHAGVHLLLANADLVGTTDIILPVVTAAFAIEAAGQTAEHMRPDHVFCDCNSVSPSTKARLAAIVEHTGATFVEAAIMAPVQPDLKRVPLVMTGHEAARIAEYLRQFGMNIEVMSGSTGMAAAVKMCRSIVIKGLEALLLECMVTAAQFDCQEAVLRSLDASNPEFKWEQLSEYMIGRVLDHGVRRAAEMNEVAAMQKEAGIPAFMSVATAEVQNWRKRFPDKTIRTPADLISALKELGEGSY